MAETDCETCEVIVQTLKELAEENEIKSKCRANVRHLTSIVRGTERRGLISRSKVYYHLENHLNDHDRISYDTWGRHGSRRYFWVTDELLQEREEEQRTRERAEEIVSRFQDLGFDMGRQIGETVTLNLDDAEAILHHLEGDKNHG